ncbi:MAG TPA: 3-dehydroquinate synthase [Cyclobacteriaceae bacterium]|nr:3-dehydroquinate synthase [Cyclobacteriaceae bacterium]
MAENVILTHNIRSELESFLRLGNYEKIAILADENTSRVCLPLLNGSVKDPILIRIHSGEEFKNLATCEKIWSEMTGAGLGRKSLMINLGGGVIGDMGGFCAATFKRGIDFINIPTSLLAMVDASVGGKSGIDFHGYKNHIGLFIMPSVVMIDAVFLDTLPENELRSGFAEVIKHSLIADESYWKKISSADFRNQSWAEHIAHSVRIKTAVVEEDPRESGKRKILNFGHTLGHAIESYFLSETRHPILHGEAVAAGMICELFLSSEIMGLGHDEAKSVVNYLFGTFGKLDIDKNLSGKIVALTGQDKKNEGGELRFSLLKKIGEASINIPVTPEQTEKALIRYIET